MGAFFSILGTFSPYGDFLSSKGMPFSPCGRPFSPCEGTFLGLAPLPKILREPMDIYISYMYVIVFFDMFIHFIDQI